MGAPVMVRKSTHVPQEHHAGRHGTGSLLLARVMRTAIPLA